MAATEGVGAGLAHADMAATSATASRYADGTYIGSSEWTKWGDYQVEVTIQGGKIVSVTETETPTDSRSSSINSKAAPVLESEATAAPSADIDAVSGATYTSTTYKASLQSALDEAAQAAAAA
ncbi:MAG: hypothetical protein QOE35_99 [Actinomycetota bacterium]